MGRMLGSHDNPEEINRPDLNQCPDCLCYFQDDCCPLCGKLCPEEMRAGNRKKVKDFKFKKGSSSNRVTFVQWYHSWVAILLFFIFMPIVGIILLITSPHKTKHKLIFVACVVLLIVVLSLIFSLIMMAVMKASIGDFLNAYMGNSAYSHLDRDEYIEICKDVSLENICKYPDDYLGDTVKLELKVYEMNSSDGDIYYACSDDEGKYALLVRDCVASGSNISNDDIIIVYGECAGDWTFKGDGEKADIVVINMFYYDKVIGD